MKAMTDLLSPDPGLLSAGNPTVEQVADELDVLARLVPLEGAQLVEAGCGNARLARALVRRFPGAQVTGLEVDERQHAANLASPQPGLAFVLAGAQAIPFAAASFDGALMLKSLHHVPRDLMAQAFSELARVLRPGGWLYVSEPLFEGALNELVRVYNDEQVVRAAAQAALDAAIAGGRWQQEAQLRFDMPAEFADFADFERRMMHPTFADHRIDEAKREAVQRLYAPHQTATGARFTRPMLARLLRLR